VTHTSRIAPRRIRDAGWLTILPLLLNAVSLGANGYIIRRLGPEGYGTLVVAMGLAGATTLLSNLGMRALYTKAVAGADDATTIRLLREQLALRSALGVLAGFLAIGGAVVFYPADRGILWCTVFQGIAVVLSVCWTVLADVLNARERFSENALIALAAGLSLTVLTTSVAALGGGAVAVGAAATAGPLTSLVLQSFALRRLGVSIGFGGATWARYRQLLREARVLAANDLVSTVQSRAEGVWAPLLFGKATIGVYDAGTLPTSRLGQVPDGVATAFFPAMASAHNRSDEVELRHQAIQMFTLLLAVTLPLATFLWFGAPYIATLMFPGPERITEADLAEFIVRVTSFTVPVAGVGIAMRYTLQAAGLHGRNAKDQMASTIVGALLGLGAALSFGVRGLAVAVVGRAAIANLVQGATFRRRFPGFIPSLPWPKLLGCLLVPASFLMLGVGDGNAAGYVTAAVVAMVSGVGYALAVIWTGLVSLPHRFAARLPFLRG
jgi:O-antigen/teichoic acid export membrane protein